MGGIKPNHVTKQLRETNMKRLGFEFDHLTGTLRRRKSLGSWWWLLFIAFVLVVFVALAPERPMRAYLVLFGLDVVELVVDVVGLQK